MASLIVFEHTHYLYLLWVLPALLTAAVWNYHRQTKAGRALGDAKLVNRLVNGSPRYVKPLNFILILLALAALITALANPRTPAKQMKPLAFADTEIVFVTDVSKSMLAADAAPNRLICAQSFMTAVVNSLKGELVGITLFAGNANTYLPLTDDYLFARNAINTLSPELIARQGTSLAGALKLSALQYNPAGKKLRILCLLTDGEDHSSGYGPVADSLRHKGIRLFAIAVGTEAGATIPVIDAAGNVSVKKDRNANTIVTRLNRQTLLTVAGNQRNQYLQLSDKKAAIKAFYIQLNQLQQQNRQAAIELKNNGSLFLYIALVLTGIAMVFPAVVTTRSNE
jgi:Ca-activated chloride channel family protein